MIQANYSAYSLTFKNPVLTSRGSMSTKQGYFIELTNGEKKGIGECSFIEGLSADDLEHYEQALQEVCNNFSHNLSAFQHLIEKFPSIVFGIETALLSLHSTTNDVLFDSAFSQGRKGIAINGLVWMGDADFMQRQVEEKLQQGFKCIKLKVGALEFATELMLLEQLRKRYDAKSIELRLDANGAFAKHDVFEKLYALSAFGIHSIEQPVAQRQWSLMHEVCAARIIDVALDEELIGVNDTLLRKKMLTEISPQYIILKPSLLGGFAQAEEWISFAEQQNIGWWATSALESNVGLNAIAQWVATKQNELPQGLGTGGLYVNNTPAKSEIRNGELWFVKTSF